MTPTIKNKPKKIMYDPENPENFVNGSESLCPEMASVNSQDDGFSCGGGEDDELLAWMAKNGF
jgi:hypothetical protein